MTDDPRVVRPRRREGSDDRLVDAARTGDRTAFGTLLRRHDDQMRALAWTVLRDGAAMDDALQDAYLKAFRNLGGFRGDARFSTWLHRIVYRTCLDHVRRRRHVVPLEETPEHPATGVGADDRVSEQMRLAAALAALDPETAAAVVLVDRDGHTYDEAGVVLGIAAGTVASRLHRGRRALRAALAEPPPTGRDGRDDLGEDR